MTYAVFFAATVVSCTDPRGVPRPRRLGRRDKAAPERHRVFGRSSSCDHGLRVGIGQPLKEPLIFINRWLTQIATGFADSSLQLRGLFRTFRQRFANSRDSSSHSIRSLINHSIVAVARSIAAHDRSFRPIRYLFARLRQGFWPQRWTSRDRGRSRSRTIFPWVRLAQRIAVRVCFDTVPD